MKTRIMLISMFKTIVLILFFASIINSCEGVKKDQHYYKKGNSQKVSAKIVSEKPETVALNFYKWYLKDIYLKRSVESPEIVLNKEKNYVIDSKKHKKFLDSSGYFSPLFYQNDLLVYKKCENQLRKVYWQEVEKSGEEDPAAFVEGNDCNFNYYMIWTNGQGEVLNKANLLKSTVNGDKASLKLQLSDTIYGSKFSQPLVSMVKENGLWKISKIRVTFEE